MPKFGDNLFFINIPKTGGCSIHIYFGIDLSKVADQNKLQTEDNFYSHLTSREVVNFIGIDKFKNYISFCFVRN